jgi:hypothetical protein
VKHYRLFLEEATIRRHTRQTTAADTQVIVIHRLRTKKLSTTAPIMIHMAMVAMVAADFIKRILAIVHWLFYRAFLVAHEKH